MYPDHYLSWPAAANFTPPPIPLSADEDIHWTNEALREYAVVAVWYARAGGDQFSAYELARLEFLRHLRACGALEI